MHAKPSAAPSSTRNAAAFRIIDTHTTAIHNRYITALPSIPRKSHNKLNPQLISLPQPNMSTSRASSYGTTSRLPTYSATANKQRQLTHLQSQLAQLTAHMSDLENLLRMTAIQAESLRGLGGYAGGM